MRSSPFQLQYERYFPLPENCCRSPTPSGRRSPVSRSSASRKNSSGDPVILSDGSGTVWSIARVRPSGDQAMPTTSGMSGSATRSVQRRAAGPLGGVGVGVRGTAVFVTIGRNVDEAVAAARVGDGCSPGGWSQAPRATVSAIVRRKPQRRSRFTDRFLTHPPRTGGISRGGTHTRRLPLPNRAQ